MQVKDLKPNPKNPRRISDRKLKAMHASVDKYGDLSGVVFNRKTKHLVTSHQRLKRIPPNTTVHIEEKYNPPTGTGTVAEGYIEHNGERFHYREVEWDKKTETEAMLAANKHSGEWDDGLLRLAIADVPNIDMELVGFEIPELKALNIQIPSLAQKEPEKEPHGHDEKADEQYVKDTPKTTEQIHTETPNSNAFENVEEKMNVVDRRYVIIIDCKDQEHKDSLKEKLRSLVTETGAKFF